jgi:hypothetical protein
VRCQVADDGPGFAGTEAPGFAGTEAPGGGGLWLAGQLTDGIEVDGGTGNGGCAVVTLMVKCRSDSRQLSE